MTINPEEAAQIVNNVAEEFVDQGRTDFATKRQLCLAILWLREEMDKQFWRSNEYRGELMELMARIVKVLGEEKQDQL